MGDVEIYKRGDQRQIIRYMRKREKKEEERGRERERESNLVCADGRGGRHCIRFSIARIPFH